MSKSHNFILSAKQKEDIANGDFSAVLSNLLKILSKHKIDKVEDVDGPYTNGNRELYIIKYTQNEYA